MKMEKPLEDSDNIKHGCNPFVFHNDDSADDGAECGAFRLAECAHQSGCAGSGEKDPAAQDAG